MMNEYMTIKDIMTAYNLSHEYVSRAIRKGWLAPVEKTQLNKSKKQFRYQVKREVVEQWRAKCGSRSRREDGRRKYTMYATSEEYEDFQKWNNSTENVNIEASLAYKPTEEGE